MTNKFHQPVEFLGGVTIDHVPGATLTGADGMTPGTGVRVKSDQVRAPRKVRLQLTNFTISILAANDYGGTKLIDLPDTNYILLGVEMDLSVTKGNVVNGLVESTNYGISVGTAAAAATPLAGTAINVLSQVVTTDDGLTVPVVGHSSDDATLTYPIQLDDSATLALYLNASAAITVNDAFTINGTIDLYLLDVGNETS